MTRRRTSGFTLVELLVVIGIIGVLLGFLLPATTYVRNAGRTIVCRNNLREMGNGIRMYANDNRDRIPDAYTVGGSVYRMAPGQKNADDPSSKPEKFGIAAVLHGITELDDLEKTGLPNRARYLRGDSKIWACPAMPDRMQAFGNTYWYNANNSVLQGTSVQRAAAKNRETFLIRDNDAFDPWVPTASRRTSGTQPPIFGPPNDATRYVYPHPVRTRRDRAGSSGRIRGALNVLFLNGQTGLVVYDNTGGAEIIQ